MGTTDNPTHREPWNKGKLVGQKAPFKPKDIWALRVRLQMEGRVSECLRRAERQVPAPKLPAEALQLRRLLLVRPAT